MLTRAELDAIKAMKAAADSEPWGHENHAGEAFEAVDALLAEVERLRELAGTAED